MKNYPLYPSRSYKNFADFISKIAEEYRDKPAISVYNAEGTMTSKTYAQLADDVYAVAEALFERRLSAKHVAVISPNSYMSLVSMLAVAYGGGVAVPLDIEQIPETILSLASFADAELVFISDNMLESMGGVNAFDGKPVVVLTSNPAHSNGFYEMLSLGNTLIAGRGRKCNGADVDPAQAALIVYTSGTTSTSKPVMLSHRSILANAAGSLELLKFPPTMYTSLPLYHVYSFTCSIINSLMAGCEICVNSDIRYMLRDLLLFKPVGMVVVPLIAEVLCKKLVDLADTGGKGFTSFIKKHSKGPLKFDSKLVAAKEKILPGFNFLICGGAHLSPVIAKVLYKFGILIMEGYGITECSPLISVNRNGFFKIGTVGMVVPGYDIKIVNDEILVKGTCVMNGYYKQPQMTAEVMEDGWFKTGDLGQIDADGFIKIIGRRKNLIVLKNGKKVSPEELESLLVAIPMAKEVMAYGSAVGNVIDDVVPAVTIYPDPDATKGMSSYEILSKLQASIDAINEKLAHYKQIRLINIREKELPKTSTKKIKRANADPLTQ